jgi:hypothetical protein
MTLPRLPFPIAMTILLTLFACQKENDPREYPQVKTLDVKGITSKGAIFCADISIRSDAPITDHGFVWSQNPSNLNFEYGENVSLGEFKGEGTFEAEISAALEANKEYYVKAYVKTQKHTVFGIDVSFFSLGSEAPVLIDFEPKEAARGDTIIITGKYLSQSQGNFFYFGGNSATQVSVERMQNQDLFAAKVIVPLALTNTEYFIFAEVVGNRSDEIGPFSILSPSISHIVPEMAGWGDGVTLHGKNLMGNDINLYINGVRCGVMGNYSDSIRFVIANQIDCGSHYANLTINGSGAFDEQGEENPMNFNIEIKAPFISDFTPKKATWGQTVTLYGKFHPVQTFSKVYFDNTIAPITRYSSDSIKVTVPTTLLSPNVTGNIPIIYKANNTEINANQDFLLEGPVISSFSPESGPGGTSISIYGVFCPGNTKLYLNNNELNLISITNNTIKTTIPYNFISGKLKFSIKIGAQTIESSSFFDVTNPSIININPKQGTFLDTITIYGSGFSNTPSINKVQLSNPDSQYTAWYPNVIASNENELKIIVPESFCSKIMLIKVTVNQNFTVSKDTFIMLKPKITGFTPLAGGLNENITVFGENFGNHLINPNLIKIGDYFPKIISSEKKKIIVNTEKLTRGDYKIFYNNCDNEEIESDQSYKCFSPWEKLDSKIVSGYYITSGYSFQFNGKGYILSPYIRSRGITITNILFTINPEEKSLNYGFITINPDQEDFYNATYFHFENKLYCVSGRTYSTNGLVKEVNAYNVETNESVKLKPFPGKGRVFGFSFSFNDKVFMGGGNNFDLWEYNPHEDSWTQKNDMPFKQTEGEFFATTIGDKGYVILYNKSVWEYSPTEDTWTQKTSFPGRLRYFPTGFAIGNIIYYGTGCSDQYYLRGETDDLWAYDTRTNDWTEKNPFPGVKRSEASSVTIGNKAYFGLGRNNGGNLYYRVPDFYEYDPTLEPPTK